MYDNKIFSYRIRLFTGILLILPGLFSSSCKKFVTIPPPRDQVVSSTVFAGDETAAAAVAGIYSQMMGSGNGNLMTGALTTCFGLSADEFYNVLANATYDPFATNTILNTNGTVQNYLWRFSYVYIYEANACLEGLAASTGVTAPVKRQLTGEALFIRAWFYFYLTGMFGDVPLETTTDYATNAVVPKTSSEKVMQQVISDLDSAQTLLTPAYPATGPIRPNKWAAVALQARAFLYQKSWPAAETAASAVINSGLYSLVKDLNSVFLVGSKEAIFQLEPIVFNQNTSEGLLFIPANANTNPTFSIPDYTLNAFEAGDQRKTAWIKSTTVGGKTYSYPYKYKVRSNFTVTEYVMVQRLAELYLIRAEARAQQNNTAGAIEDLDSIRVRAGLLPLPSTLDRAACLLAVEQERRSELFTEWGHRWLDLRRTQRMDAVLGVEKSKWSATDSLYPIPYTEIQKNVFLTQNPGYE
jgi:hypothetical protein